jgi:hypothetical protein
MVIAFFVLCIFLILASAPQPVRQENSRRP